MGVFNKWSFVLMTVAVCASGFARAEDQRTPVGAEVGAVRIPFSSLSSVPDGTDARWLSPAEESGLIEMNSHYIRRPQAGADRARWLDAMVQLRAFERRQTPPTSVRMQYHGTRAWVRMRPDVGRELDLQTGEAVEVKLEARSIGGNAEVCFALDYMNRRGGDQAGWSGVLTTATIPADGGWHPLTTVVKVPKFDGRTQWANLIVGQDATRNPASGTWDLRHLEVVVAGSPPRRQVADRLSQAASRPTAALDLGNYERPDLAWAAKGYTCGFAFMYDRAFYNPQAGGYRVESFLADFARRFGKADSVVLWHAYPRIGVDDRNQFDFYRDMPGGITGLKDVVYRLHRSGVKAFIDYNPWDTGTWREGIDDADALARLVADIGADGIFLDTMTESPATLRQMVDRRRPGVVFEPEGSPPVEQLAMCNASWAQWLSTWPEPGVLRLKWIEPRHMQHQIRRWDRAHADEIEAAFFNGSGMLVWENVFGTWNPWTDADADLWRQATTILRSFANELTTGAWEPFAPTLVEGVYANRWFGERGSITLLVNRTGSVVTAPVMRIASEVRSPRVFDLWQKKELTVDDKGRVATSLGRLGAIVASADADVIGRAESIIYAVPASAPAATAEPQRRAVPVLCPVEPTAPADASSPPSGMVLVPRSQVRMRIQHERRECGCYPDPGSAAERLDYFMWGTPFNETITHDFGPVTVGPLFVDECLVTNRQFDEFLQATSYRPREPRNFLRHWQGKRCPDATRDHPVVYVDLDDARAYAKWAGKRLPTEEEWQLAGQSTDGRRWPWGGEFDAARCNSSGRGTSAVRAFPAGRSPFGCYDMTGNVWQWTESERDDGHTRFGIIRGGSWYDAKGSSWYLHGGPQPLDHHAKFILMYPGLDRCATVGFRCVKDVGAK